MVIIPKEIQDNMLADAVKYNIRLHFPNAERTDICNNMIVNGSAKFTESLCSQDKFKFGLCESPVFECETVGVGNITGLTFELFYEVICKPTTSGAEFRTDLQQYVFPIKKGVFVVTSAERQSDLQHRKIVAYGGGAENFWEMPNYEKKKISGWSRYSEPSKITYTPDIYKLIQSMSYCEKKTEIPIIDDTAVSSGISVKIRDKYFYCNSISKVNTERLPNSHRVVKDFYDEITTYEKCIEETAKKLIPDITKAELELIMKEVGDYYEYNHVGMATPSYFRIRKGKNFYDRDIGGYSMLCYIPYGVECVYNNHIEKGYFLDNIKLYEVGIDGFSYVKSVKYSERNEYLKTNLQKMAESIIELDGKVAYYSSNGQLVIIDITKRFNLLPSDDLRPSEDLKPLGVTGGSITKNMYSSLWYEESYTKPWGRVYCEYTNTSGTQSERNIYLNGFDSESDLDDFQTYSITSNEIIKENQYTQAQITAIMNNIADSIKDVSYVPLKLNCVSIPFVECGDTLEVLTQNNDSITTIVMNRTLSGESFIKDEITSV